MSVEAALEAALESTPRLPRDAATVQLALRYAELIDDLFERLVSDAMEEDGAAHARTVLAIARTGARLEATLDRLGMAPSARPILPQNGGQADGRSPEVDQLDVLRRDAAAGGPASGVDYAAAVDPSVTAADAED